MSENEQHEILDEPEEQPIRIHSRIFSKLSFSATLLTLLMMFCLWLLRNTEPNVGILFGLIIALNLFTLLGFIFALCSLREPSSPIKSIGMTVNTFLFFLIASLMFMIWKMSFRVME